MEAEPLFDFQRLACELEGRSVRFLLIGRQALILRGAPVHTFDYDLWVDPDARAALFDHLVRERGFESSGDPAGSAPLISVFAGHDKLDLFLFREVINREGEALTFEEAWQGSILFEDPVEPTFRMRTPSNAHLILLKKLRPPNRKDEEDIKYLMTLAEES
jgi:hypothetical protein